MPDTPAPEDAAVASGPEPPGPHALEDTGSLPLLVLRGAVGGTLMGLANLVPGISGGTMLLAAGVYPRFIAGIAELTTLRFRLRSLVLLASVGGLAALVILLLAGSVKGLVQEHRWVMYSLFIGLTFGGVPLLWRLARPATPAVYVAAAASFALMVVMALGEGARRTGSGGPVVFFLAGLAASAAMILPGVSGGYLLLLMGQYEPILATIDRLKRGLLGDTATGAARDLGMAFDTFWLLVPLGIGVVGGVVGVSNLLRWLLARYEKATLGALLGLLFGAVVGLWPYQVGRPPQAGDVIEGRVVTAETARQVEVDDWPVVRFDPTPGQLAGGVALVAAGLAATLLLGRLGSDEQES